MKKLLLLLCFFFLASSQIYSQLLVENFDYPAGDSLTQHGFVAFSGTGNALFVTSPGLTFPTYAGSGIGNATTLVLSTASSQDAYKAFTTCVDTLSLYASFMVRVDSASLAGDYFVALLPSTSTTLFTGRVYVKQASNGNLAFGLSKIGTAGTIVYSDSIYTKGTTYLLLLKYTFNEGSTTDDAISLFVFSAPPPSIEPAPTVGPLTGPNDLVDVCRFALRQGTNTPRAIVDGIYVERSYNNAVLPVELASFTSTVNRRDVTLNWTTATENNNSGFDIERSIVNDEWSMVGNVSGNGTSTTPHNYTFDDRGLNSGKYNYRLKQIDFNGNFAYYNLSNEVIIGVPTKFDLSQNYPNPFNPSTKINYDLPFDSKVSIKLFDLSGREVANLVNEVKTAGYHTINFNASNLSSGVYFYKISAEGNENSFVSTKKMMLIK